MSTNPSRKRRRFSLGVLDLRTRAGRARFCSPRLRSKETRGELATACGIFYFEQAEVRYFALQRTRNELESSLATRAEDTVYLFLFLRSCNSWDSVKSVSGVPLPLLARRHLSFESFVRPLGKGAALYHPTFFSSVRDATVNLAAGKASNVLIEVKERAIVESRAARASNSEWHARRVFECTNIYTQRSQRYKDHGVLSFLSSCLSTSLSTSISWLVADECATDRSLFSSF